MKELCNLCSHQISDKKGGVQCRKAAFSSSDGYGEFKQGARCIYDEDSLNDFFKMRTGHEISIQNMSSTIERQEKDLSKSRDRITALERRLLIIDDV